MMTRPPPIEAAGTGLGGPPSSRTSTESSSSPLPGTRRSGRHSPTRVERWLRAGALGLGVLLVAYPMVLAGFTQRIVLVALPAAAALVVAAFGPRGWTAGAAGALLAAEYAMAVTAEGVAVDLMAPLVAVIWFGLLEVLDLLDLDAGPSRVDGSVVVARARSSIPVALAGGAVGGVALALRFASGDLGVAATVGGAACLLALLAIVVGAATRAVRSASGG
jgi:hypothetical protein